MLRKSNRSGRLAPWLAAAALALMLAVLNAGPAVGRGGSGGGGKGGKNTTPSGKCYVTPAPVVIPYGYTIFASGLPALDLVNAFISDELATGILMGQAGTDGACTFFGYAQFAMSGTKYVTIHDAATGSVLAQCTFLATY